MAPIEVGFAGLGLVLVLLALRVPIAVSLGSVSIIGIYIIRGPSAAFGALGTLPYDFAAHWTLAAVPMFLLLGAVCYHSGLTGGLYDAARLWFNRLPGGLAVASNFASAGFAAVSGSSVATSAAMGRLAIPEMLAMKYDKALATGTIAAAGTLGVLIPPSIPFVIYGWYTEQPIGKLLIAGVLPGLLTATCYALMIILRCSLNRNLAPQVPEAVASREKWKALGKIWPLPVLILGVIGGIYGGITTPSEAGAFGAFLACVIAITQGRMNWQVFRDSITEALRTTSSILFIAIGAILLTRFLAVAGVPTFVTEKVVGDFALDPLTLILAMSVVYIVLGMFLDPLGLMLLTLPVFLPMFEALNLDLIWLGVLVVKYLEIGVLTPPVGLNVYVVKGVVGDAVPLGTIFLGVTWFLACEVVTMTLLIAYPEISLFLPSLM